MIKKMVSICCVLFLCSGFIQAADEIPLHVVTQQKMITFSVEVANTRKLIGQGLQHRKSLAKNKGMLFVFPYQGEHGFWMKNTHISLDIIFIDSNFNIVHIEKNTTPLTQTGIGRGVVSQYVLEINAGLSDQYGFEIGNKIIF